MSTPSMVKAGFFQATTTSVRSLFIAVNGHDNTGKTHFALTAPGDIAFFNLDKGIKGVIEKFVPLKTIYVQNVIMPLPKTAQVIEENYGKKIAKNVAIVDDDVVTQASGSLDSVINNSRVAMAEPSIKTLVFDTGTALWELWRVARFGKLLQVPPSAYPPVNAEFVGFCDELKDSGKNIIFTHKMRPVYLDDKRTNRYEPAAFNTMNYITDVTIETMYDPDEQKFSLMFTRCKARPELQYDTEIVEILGIEDFPLLASLVVDGTTPGDWI